MLLELIKYFKHLFVSKHDGAEITIVRRYPTAAGWIGELFFNGRYVGVTCDGINFGEEVFKHSLDIGFEQSHRVLRTKDFVICRGDFQSKVPFGSCYVGSLDPKENDVILSNLVDKVEQFRYLRLTIINRPLVES